MKLILRTLLVSSLVLASAAVATSDRSVAHNAALKRSSIKEPAAVKGRNLDEDTKVKDTLESLIDLIFKERKVRDAFARYFLFSNLSSEQKRMIDPTSLHYSDEVAALDAGTVARIFSTGWDYEYQSVVLALGMKPLSDFEEAVEQAGSEVDNERKRILRKRGLSEEDFYTLLDRKAVKDRKLLENELTTLELINADIDRFIAQRTNHAVLSQNLLEMKTSLSINKVNRAGCVVYAVKIKPIFTVVFIQEHHGAKMISFGDTH
ncbi:MAG TPA: hypothetical protein VFX97_18040 [Pyrinomonadaceae bacterium]|nr:hypothetical protein [Pyrinomonadaceae bacterium]